MQALTLTLELVSETKLLQLLIKIEMYCLLFHVLHFSDFPFLPNFIFLYDYLQSKAEGMISNLLVMCLCIFCGEGRTYDGPVDFACSFC